MDSGFNQVLRVRLRRSLVYMDDQRNWIAVRKFLCPTDYELFRIIIEVSLLERRRSIELNNCSIRSTKTSI
jgi:hypothetical protein